MLVCLYFVGISESTNRLCRNRLNRLGPNLVNQIRVECLGRLYVIKLFIQAEMKSQFNSPPDYFIANIHITARKLEQIFLPDVFAPIKNL